MPIAQFDLDLLKKHAHGRYFVIETGGGGNSTKYLAATQSSGSIIVTIDVSEERCRNRVLGVDYQIGWSVRYEDLIKKGHKLFYEIPDRRKRNKYKWEDRKVAVKGKRFMKGQTDLIRKVVLLYQRPVDFFFCDTGEYCGLAEWNVVRNIISKGGLFACHDIYYPKSIKCFQAVRQIEASDEWRVLDKTTSRQGLLIAEKIY